MKRVVLPLLVTLAAGCTSDRFTGQIGESAPTLAVAIMGGDSLRLAELQGSVVLLNVWATWCIPCRKELPELQALHQQYEARGLRVLGVNVDESGSDSAVRDYAKELGITYTILRDPGEQLFTAFAIVGMPASFLIDRKGRIAWKKLGPFMAADPELQRALQNTL